MATLMLRRARRPNRDGTPPHVLAGDLFTSDDNSNTPPRTVQSTNRFPVDPCLRDSSDSFAHSARPSQDTRTVPKSSPRGLIARFLRKLIPKSSAFSQRQQSKYSQSQHWQNVDSQRPRAHTLLAFEDDYESHSREHGTGGLTAIESDLDSAPFPPPIRIHPSAAFVTTHASREFTDPSNETVEHELSRHHHHDQHYSLLPQNILRTLDEDNTGSAPSDMASEQAPPPVSYERLRQLTTEACDSTLSSIQTYNHNYTETWNTQIINTILAALVTEASPNTSDGSAPQPSYKFVVNSTIIQHSPVAPGAGEDVVKSSGRRGMHSASGAYWNNEKDGMWSFKYEAAEAKGLDVVVGIVWIWVG